MRVDGSGLLQGLLEAQVFLNAVLSGRALQGCCGICLSHLFEEPCKDP